MNVWITMEMLSLLILGFQVSLGWTDLIPWASLDHWRLQQHVASDYDTRIRPVKNWSHPTKLYVHIKLYQVLEVSETENVIKIYCWMEEEWTDEMLHWEPEEYGGLSFVDLPHDSIWEPDNVFLESVRINTAETERRTSVRVKMVPGQNGGRVVGHFPAVYQLNCAFNIRLFPFDRQTCVFTHASWNYDSRGIVFETEKPSLEHYSENGEWIIESFEGESVNKSYACCPHAYSELKYTLTMRRKHGYYTFTLVLPTLVISAIACIGFFLPAGTDGQRHEKVSLGITTLLSVNVVMMSVGDKIPKTASFVPLISWFFVWLLLIIGLATISTIAIIYIQLQSRRNRDMPEKLVAFINSSFGRLFSRGTEPQLARTCFIKEMIASATSMLGLRSMESRGREMSLVVDWAVLASIVERISLCSMIFLVAALCLVFFGMSFA